MQNNNLYHNIVRNKIELIMYKYGQINYLLKHKHLILTEIDTFKKQNELVNLKINSKLKSINFINIELKNILLKIQNCFLKLQLKIKQIDPELFSFNSKEYENMSKDEINEKINNLKIELEKLKQTNNFLSNENNENNDKNKMEEVSDIVNNINNFEETFNDKNKETEVFEQDIENLNGEINNIKKQMENKSLALIIENEQINILFEEIQLLDHEIENIN